jgi:hypothetical protein
MNKNVKRSLVIKLKDGTSKELPISKATRIKSDEMGMMHFDKLQDGTWRLTFNDSIIDNFSKIESFFIKRED